MKKFLAVLVCVGLVCAMGAGLTGCEKKETKTTPTTPTTPTTKTTT